MSKTKNLAADTASMFEVLTDLFPGVEECIFNNLTVRDECTDQGCIYSDLFRSLQFIINI